MVDLHWMTATELAPAIAAGDLSPVEVADAVTERIASLDPGIGAIVWHDPDQVRRQAIALEEELRASGPRGPLHGVPYVIKDLDDVEGVPTSYGIPLLRDEVATKSSVVAERMDSAGGLFVGKSNAPEMGYQGVTRCHAHGRTVNPWREGRTAGGSSGGSAAAVAAGMVPIGDGSDGAGSIRIPASFCGVVGFKPSFGRVPVEYGFDQTIVHHGPIARTVADAALMFSVTEGFDPRDPRSIGPSGLDPVADLRGGVDGLRVGWAPALPGFEVADDVASCVEDAVGVFSADLGCRVEEVRPGWDDPVPTMWTHWQAFYGQFAALIPSEGLEGQIDDELLELVHSGAALGAAEIHRASALRMLMWEQVLALFEDHDVLVVPTMPCTAFPDDLDHPVELSGAPLRDRILGWLMTCTFNLASACPVVALPCGFDAEGLPIGLSVVGRPWDDAGALRAAAAFERATAWHDRHPPS
jgi:aspartyl-tRNA(Asn)/glutamyl-tRNA(Gln) amidotransferase subunit A